MIRFHCKINFNAKFLSYHNEHWTLKIVGWNHKVSAVIMKTAWEVVFKLKNCEGNEDNNYYLFEKRIQNLPTFIRTLNEHLIPWLNIIVHFNNFNWPLFRSFPNNMYNVYKRIINLRIHYFPNYRYLPFINGI